MLVLALFSMLTSCCEDHVDQEERSPSGDKIAVVAYRDCGVLADGTSVTLGDAYLSRENVVISATGRHAFIVTWKDDRTLKVSHTPQTAKAGGFADPQIAHKNEEVNGIRIEDR